MTDQDRFGILTDEQCEEVSAELAKEGGEQYKTIRECLDAMGAPYSSADAIYVADKMRDLWGFGKCCQCGRFSDWLNEDDMCELCEYDKGQNND